MDGVVGGLTGLEDGTAVCTGAGGDDTDGLAGVESRNESRNDALRATGAGAVGFGGGVAGAALLTAPHSWVSIASMRICSRQVRHVTVGATACCGDMDP